MQPCQVQGKPHLYGLGIRVAFYVQWFGAVLSDYLEVSYLADVRLLGLLLSAAAFLGLVVQLSSAGIQPVEAVIVHLLAVGLYLPLVPLYVWRAITLGDRYWNPARWTKERLSPAFKGMDFALLLALTSLGIWLWASYVPDHGCSRLQRGFLFSPVPLGNTAYVVFNSMLYIIIILVCLGILLGQAGNFQIWIERRRRRRRRRKTRRAHVMLLRNLQTISTLIVASTVTAAIELTIAWNDISDVDDISDVAQFIPLFATAGFVVRAIFMHFAQAENSTDNSSDSGGDYRGPSSRPSMVPRSRLSDSPDPDIPSPPPVHNA